MKYNSVHIVKTADGSHTVKIADIDEHYHSVNGALSESLHVFINNGFYYVNKNRFNILEIGFGTGLNAMLTFMEAEKSDRIAEYTALELYPVDKEIFCKLNYAEILNVDSNKYFLPLHTCEWNKSIELSKNFTFKKINIDLNKYTDDKLFDVIYFDAFAPDKQSELWSERIFEKMFSILNNGGILVTYSSKGEVKRSMRSVGFTVKRLQGAAGKHHMIRAEKINNPKLSI
ncbi:MAG: tRNA (5-methylaminomethyl-2-thiouridine)(34)-methyltransferase MnmD [Prevotellaceae bacterium]|jgi:tRNA U34 5-methylaminomethyl-2-thiouridine-forming methyltransferase MnmC|nr:tRNA (5-methylaminomethyl-2-thiouridine)(34)-methyltransferase MnmD [Prevotellaceae bacterium]